MLAPRLLKLPSQRDVNLWRIPLRVSLGAIALFGVTIVPDLVVSHWYHAFLHNNRGAVLRTLLRLRGGPRVVVVNVPFYVDE